MNDVVASDEVPRISVTRFRAIARGGMDLPVIVTVDGEDVFAVVDMSVFRAIMEVQRGRLSGALGSMTPLDVAREKYLGESAPAWVPIDLAGDT